MAPKEKPSKKAQQKKQAKLVEDATFGLKNKNKSKKVQSFINQVEKGVKNSGPTKDSEKYKEAKKNAKLLKEQADEELRILFNEGLAGQYGKKKSKAQAEARASGVDVSLLKEPLPQDSTDEDSDEEDSEVEMEVEQAPAVEAEAIEVFKVKTLEDIIDEQRAKLAAEGKAGTPVTAESFARWRAAKLLKRQEEAEAKLKAEQTKKKGGKGLSVLSGKQLFNYNASLFIDDDGAIDATEEKDYNSASKLQQQEDEKRSREEYQRAQEEQQRLYELHKLEVEARIHEENERRRAARQRPVHFTLDGVRVNELVFIPGEDLSLFEEDETLVVNEDLFDGDFDLSDDDDDDA